MSRNILLDWSGTLVDDLPSVLIATNRILARFGLAEMSRAQFCEHFRLPFAEFYAEILPGVPMPELEALYLEFFEGLNECVPLLPGAFEFLQYCRNTNRRVFLLSSIKSEHFSEQSQRLGVQEFFEYPYVEVLDKRKKITAILETHSLSPEETLFVGDMVHDMETARHGGVTSVAVLTGFDSLQKLSASAPDIIVQNLSKLQRLLG